MESTESMVYQSAGEYYEQSKARRKTWFHEHTVKLLALLDAPCKAEVDGRVWRTYYWQDGELLSVQLMQAINLGVNTPPNAPRVGVTLTRGYNDTQSHVQQLTLGEPYHDVKDIVVFLRLDTVDPTEVDWDDVTRYSSIVTVRDILKDAKLNGH